MKLRKLFTLTAATMLPLLTGLSQSIPSSPPSGAAATNNPPSAATTVVVQPTPPPPQVEVVPVCPGPDYLWTPGWWSWNGDAWIWFGGYWGHPTRPGHVWHNGYFYHGRGAEPFRGRGAESFGGGHGGHGR